MRFLPSLFSQLFLHLVSRGFLSIVPSLCLVVLCAHRALPGIFDSTLLSTLIPCMLRLCSGDISVGFNTKGQLDT